MRRIILFLLLLTALTAFSAAGADVLGIPVEEGATSVSLVGMKGMDGKVKNLIADLENHPGITEVNLSGVELKTASKATLVKECPGVHFIWTVKLGNAVISSEDTVMDLDTPKGFAKLSAIRDALYALPNIKTVNMFKYSKQEQPPTIEGMEDYLLSVFPDVKFNWTLNWLICSGRRVHLRTDATAFSTAKGRQDPRYTADQIWARLKHFPDLLAIDVGHNNVSDLSFLTNFPKLRRFICVDSKKPVTDLSPLEGLMDLEYVELFMQDITDLSPLANHVNLIDLNLCHNNVTDLSPLYTCTNLKRLWISYNPNLTDAEVAEFKRHVPDCQVETVEYQSTGAGWREIERYNVLIESFDSMTYIPFAESQPLE